jgi:hypothetical protein
VRLSYKNKNLIFHKLLRLSQGSQKFSSCNICTRFITTILGFCPGFIYSPASEETDTSAIYRNNEGWITIQNRGQCNYPKDFFSIKNWNEYENGFGIPGKIDGVDICFSASFSNPFSILRIQTK